MFLYGSDWTTSSFLCISSASTEFEGSSRENLVGSQPVGGPYIGSGRLRECLDVWALDLCAQQDSVPPNTDKQCVVMTPVFIDYVEGTDF